MKTSTKTTRPTKKAPNFSARAIKAQKTRGTAGRKAAALRAHATRARMMAELWPAEVAAELNKIADQRARAADKLAG
jgi:hypothetical protein